MKKFIRFFSLAFLCLFVTVQSYGQYILQDQDVVVQNGTIVACSYKGVDIIIPEYLDGQEVVRIGDHAFSTEKVEKIEKVVFPSTLKSIGKSAFASSKFTEIEFPEGLTHIGAEAFSGGYLEVVEFPSTLKSIGSDAFYYNELTDVIFSEGITNIGDNAFSSNKLTTINLPQSLTSIGYNAFASNSSKELTLPSPSIDGQWYAGEVAHEKGAVVSTDYADYIYKVNSSYTLTDEDVVVEKGEITDIALEAVYTNIVIPQTLDGQAITKIGTKAFYKKSLNEVSLPEGLKTIGVDAFASNNLSVIDLPEGLQVVLANAFYDNKFTEMILPEGLVSIGEMAFYGNQLSDITLPNTVIDLGRDAFGYNKFWDVLLPEPTAEGQWYSNSYKEYEPGEYVSTNGVYFYEVLDVYTLTDTDVEVVNGSIVKVTLSGSYVNIVIPEVLDGQTITSIGEKAFQQRVLDSVSFPETLESIGAFAFDMSSLRSVTLPQSLKKIEKSAFGWCNLTEVEFPEGLLSIGYSAFAYNTIEVIELPQTLTYIGSSAFYTWNAGAATKFALPSPSVEGQWYAGETLHDKGEVVSINSEYIYKANGTYVLTDNDVIVDNGTIVSVTLNAVYADIEIPQTLKGQTITGIGNDVFNGLSLENVKLPETLENISYQAFYGNNLAEVVLPQGLKFIGTSAFEANKLAEVVLPQGVISIGKGAFNRNELTSFTLPVLPTQDGFEYSNWVSSTGSIHAEEEVITNVSLAYDAVYTQTGHMISVLVKGAENASIAITGDSEQVYSNIESINFMANKGTSLVVTPTKEGYTFDPISVELTSIEADQNVVINATAELYNIVYHNVEESQNPESYTIETETIVLATPTNGIREFLGWYTEATFENQITEITQGSTGDLDLYAKWSEITSSDDEFLSVSIYPNPATAYFSVNTSIDTIKVYNSLGSLVKQFTTSAQQYDISELRVGMYIIVIESEGKTSTQRLIKQ